MLHDDFIDLATKVKMDGIPVNVAAFMRENDVSAMEAFHVMQYPTIRLYKGNGGGFVEFPAKDDGSNLKTADFLAFLKENGIAAAEKIDPAKLVGAIE